MRRVLATFIVVPVIEMVILIEVGGLIGALPTVALVVLTAVIGVALLKHEGMETLARVQNRLSVGELPATELLEGVMLIVGGALLLTPGFVTDSIGFVCLIPYFRRPLAQLMIRKGIIGAVPRFFTATNNDGQTLEGEFRSEDSDTDHHLPKDS